MRGVQRVGHSERERHPNGEGLSGLGQSGHEKNAGVFGDQDAQLEPPRGVPIRQAWIAGRIGIGFVDSGDPTGPNIPFGGDGDPGRQHASLSLTSLEALDVELRPYIWDL